MRDLWNGYPDASELSGWHWIDDAVGLRPLLWHGDDWPDPGDRQVWEDGFALCAPSDLADALYLGPVVMPPAVLLRFRAAAGLDRGGLVRQRGVSGAIARFPWG